ncbi:arsenate reductase/protein-tyrosine-phosphatase family protein [Geodermatophilus sp. SYSU D00696]
MSPHPTVEPTFTVLLVCTGNICRSALGERLGRAYLESLGDGTADRIRLVSAGTQAVSGAAMHPDSALVLRGLGGDPSGFHARQFVGAMADGADLTLTMTRQHRRDVLRAAPRALSRTYTLREAAGLLDVIGEDVDVASADVVERARRLVQHLASARSRWRSGPEDDVEDPIGQPVEVHQDVGEAIAVALIRVLERLASPAQEGPTVVPSARPDVVRGRVPAE